MIVDVKTQTYRLGVLQ